MTAPAVARTVYVEKIPATDRRLRRQIRHDSESRRYAHPTDHLTIASVEHKRILPILDQGQAGKCTAETGCGLLGTEPYWSQQVADRFTAAFGEFGDTGTDRLYDAEETIDGDGPYPPNDNGSSGLTLAKALRAAGLISGWTQTFSLDGFLKALTQYPIAVGTYWYESMFHPDRDGLLTVDATSGLAGGHEYEAVSYDTTTGLIGFANSWGTGWGKAGRFHMRDETFGKLLAHKGDATVLTPLTQPAPTPTPGPTDDPDRKLLTDLTPWLSRPHTGDTAAAARSVLAWRATKHL